MRRPARRLNLSPFVESPEVSDEQRFEPLGICCRASRIGVAEQLSPDGSLAGIAAGLWRSSARKYKEYALNPCCPACGRDLVDCLSEKMFARSKCKAKMEVGADG